MREATVAELKERAKALGIKGYAQMNKAALLEAIQVAEHAPADDAGPSEAPAAEEISRSSQQDLDYASHPKFHKFKGKAKGAE